MKLLITDKIDESGLTPLKKYFQIEKRFGIKLDELEKIIKNFYCLITRSSTAIDQNLFSKAKKLKIIARAGIGVDNIDIFTATKKGVAVINAPKGNARSTAEHTIGLMFALLRHIPQAHADLSNGIWGKQKYIGTQVKDKTLGIVGFGNVGQEVYKLAKGLGMKVLVCEPYIRLPKDVKKATFEDLLTQSDLVSLHVPATHLTKGMINKNTLSLIKKGAFLINCSRGPVVNEKAVIQSLKDNHLGGFAVDVFDKEPAVNPELFTFPNVVATPHIAGSTVEPQRQSLHEIVTGIIQYTQGIPPTNLLNPQVFQKKRKVATLPHFDAVIFDCDSTLCHIEGVDELAGLVGKKETVARLTQDAMDGKVRFEDVYKRRLDIIKPNRTQIEKLGQLYIDHLAPEAREMIAALLLVGKKIYIVSSGFWGALVKLGLELGIPAENIFGNDLLFTKSGKFLQIMEGPLIRNNGKLQIIRQIPGRKILIGDSVTDLETKEYVDMFIGYGGVVRREKVEKESDMYIRNISMSPALIISAGFENCKGLLSTEYRKFIGKGIDILFHEKEVKLAYRLKIQLSEFKKLAYYQERSSNYA